MSVPGKIHHIMAHALDGMKLFRDKQDRRVFLNLFAEGLKKTRFRCYGWSLMNNHYHLVVRTNELHLSELMRTLNSRYAKYYNKKYKRRGYLFRDRYRSIVAGDQRYAMELLRYVHLNPIRAKVCRSMKELAVYPWTGHAALMGTMSNEFQHIDPVLRRFGRDLAESRAKYEAFLQRGLEQEEEDEVARLIGRSNAGVGLHDEPSCWVIGEREFVAEAIRRDTEHAMRLSRLKRAEWTLERLAQHVGEKLGLEAKRLTWRFSRGPYAKARSALAAVGYRQMGVAQTKIADFLGVTPSAVSAMVRRGEELIPEVDIDSALQTA